MLGGLLNRASAEYLAESPSIDIASEAAWNARDAVPRRLPTRVASEMSSRESDWADSESFYDAIDEAEMSYDIAFGSFA